MPVTEVEARRTVCKASFWQFVRQFWECVPGAGTLIENWHMEYIANVMQEVMERAFKRLPKLYDVVINISPGTSKPVWEEMPVMMADGTWKRLKAVNVGDYVIGKSGRPCKVSAVYEQGELDCVRLKTFGGRKITTAEDHPILTADGWCDAGDVRVNQMLALMHKPKIQSSTDRTLDEFKMAGYFIGDGSTTGNNCSLTSKDPEYIDDFVACCERMGYQCTIRKDKNGVTIIRPIAKTGERESFVCSVCGLDFVAPYRAKMRCCSKECNKKWLRGYKAGCREWIDFRYSKVIRNTCRQWLRDVGIAGKSSKTKRVPDFVWLGSDEQISAFLAAYFHCDGCVSYKHAGKRNIVVSMCSISYKLAKGIQRLLLRLGVQMSLRKHVAKNGYAYNPDLKNYVYYTVETTEQDSASRFLEKVSLHGRKKEKLKGFKPERRLFEQKYLPDRVESIENVGKLPCRCLTVDGDASFVIDGVVVHNSSIASILFPAWCWACHPSTRVLSASHTETLVLDLATKARDIITSDKYRECYPEIELVKDQATKGYYRNTLGGDRYTCTVSGKSPMGMHALVQLVDDPIDPKSVLSEAELKTASEFMTDHLPSRMVDKAVTPMFLIMQRLRRGDPTDVVLDGSKKEGAYPVRHICLPAEEADNISPPELRAKYVDGLMDPVRLGHRVLASFKTHPYSYAGQYGQSPQVLGGGLFKSTYFLKRCKAAPYHAKRIMYTDRASATTESSCYTAIVLLAKDNDGSYYVEELTHGRWEPIERNKIIRATALKYRSRYGPKNEPAIWVEAEGGSSGRDAWIGMARAMDGFNVREDQVTGSKDARAEPWSCQLASGNVFLCDNGESEGTGKATWDINYFIQEHLFFRPEPGKKLGRWKDVVDATTGAYNLLSGGIISTNQSLRTYTIGTGNKGQMRIVLCNREELSNLVIDNRSLLLSISNPHLNGLTELPVHGLNNLLDSLHLHFADIAPEEEQEQWNDPIQPYGLPAEKLVMKPDHGKQVWKFLLKKREPAPEVLVIQDEGNRIGLAVAYGICAILHCDPAIICYRPSDPECVFDGQDVGNRHVYDTLRLSRGQVIT